MKIEILSRVFNEDNYMKLVNFVERGFKNISFDDNFGGEVVEVDLPASATMKVPHGLKSTPKSMLILKQIGSGQVTSADEKWTDSYIVIQNHDANPLNLRIGIFRS